jgi:hypothetical protein
MISFEIINSYKQFVQQHSFWVKAKNVICDLRQSFWYIACNKCTKGTGMEYNKTFFCLNCKELDALAQPRHIHSNFMSSIFNLKI